MNLEQSKTLLPPLLEALKKRGVRCFPVEGTLIGWMRHKNFIEWDHDIDIGVMAEEWDDRLVQDFRQVLDIMKMRAWKDDWKLKIVGKDKKGRMTIIRLKPKGQEDGNPHIDFHIFYKEGDYRYYSWFKDILARVPDSYFLPLTPINYQGYEMHCVAEPDKLLEWYYGDWRTPVPRAEYMESEERKNRQKNYLILPS